MDTNSIWHYTIETLPRVEWTDKDKQCVDLHIPIGIWCSPESSGKFRIILEITVNDGESFRIGDDESNPKGNVVTINKDFISKLRRSEDTFPDAQTKFRPYSLFIDPASLNEYTYKGDNTEFALLNNNIYREAVIKGLRLYDKVAYKVFIFPLPIGQAKTIGPYTIYLIKPEFGYGDIVYMTPNSNISSSERSVLYYKRDNRFHYLRIDYLDIETPSDQNRFVSLPKLELHAGRYTIALPNQEPEKLLWLPLINPYHDYIVVPIPIAQWPEASFVQLQGMDISIDKVVNRNKSRVVFVHYCMQGINDLFELPEKIYSPPRTFIQITMRDEQGIYSSRPDYKENFEEDGYSYSIEFHRHFGIKHLWTFNGGVLALIAGDCPTYLQDIKDDIKMKILSPTIAGFGGHRLPYYQEETNYYSIGFGIDMLKEILGDCNSVYYLDQRLYKQTSNVYKALQDNKIEYLVVDATTGCTPYIASIEKNDNAQGISLANDNCFNYLWCDKKTGLYILYIDDTLRNYMVGSSNKEHLQGKLAWTLRERFMRFACDPSINKNNLLVYSDDADKASGNGWFDGDYSNAKVIEFNDKYFAALEWIADHPWIEAVSPFDLKPQSDCIGTINMETAVCPSVDPGGILTWDAYGKQIHFDAWYDNWKNFRSTWLDLSYEEISQKIEFAIIDWPSVYKNQLYQLGQMYFSILLHESQWNKQPLEDGDPNTRLDVDEPEDFVMSATLQLRNAQVYLNASTWAMWAISAKTNNTFCNSGPVIDSIKRIYYQTSDRNQYFSGLPLDPTGLHWDNDPMANVIMYNNKMLIVMDQNGGRITHLFVINDGFPYSVSGTFKCYQFLTGEKIIGATIPCDGEVLQNTVYTPNHSYIACDVLQSKGVIGKKFNPKAKIFRDIDWYFPDNFNGYEYSILSNNAVEWLYTQTTPAPNSIYHTHKEYYKGQRQSELDALLRTDHVNRQNGLQGVVWHGDPPFQKKISLNGSTIFVEYSNVRPGHIVANEFCLDLYRNMMFAERNARQIVDRNTIRLTNNKLTATIALANNSKFTDDTLSEFSTNPSGYLRLHRVLTDCLEIECTKGGNFSYSIECR